MFRAWIYSRRAVFAPALAALAFVGCGDDPSQAARVASLAPATDVAAQARSSDTVTWTTSGGNRRALAEFVVTSEGHAVRFGGESAPVVSVQGELDADAAGRFVDHLDAEGQILEVELTVPAGMPVEQLVFFLEERGKVPIIKAAPAPTSR